MKKTACFVIGSLIGGGVAGFIGFFVGVGTPFALADKCEHHCIAWRRIKNGKEVIDFYGNTDMFPELKKEETSD